MDSHKGGPSLSFTQSGNEDVVWRQTEKDKDRHPGRQANGQTDRQTDNWTEKQKYMKKR